MSRAFFQSKNCSNSSSCLDASHSHSSPNFTDSTGLQDPPNSLNDSNTCTLLSPSDVCLKSDSPSSKSISNIFFSNNAEDLSNRSPAGLGFYNNSISNIKQGNQITKNNSNNNNNISQVPTQISSFPRPSQRSSSSPVLSHASSENYQYYNHLQSILPTTLSDSNLSSPNNQFHNETLLSYDDPSYSDQGLFITTPTNSSPRISSSLAQSSNISSQITTYLSNNIFPNQKVPQPNKNINKKSTINNNEKSDYHYSSSLSHQNPSQSPIVTSQTKPKKKNDSKNTKKKEPKKSSKSKSNANQNNSANKPNNYFEAFFPSLPIHSLKNSHQTSTKNEVKNYLNSSGQTVKQINSNYSDYNQNSFLNQMTRNNGLQSSFSHLNTGSNADQQTSYFPSSTQPSSMQMNINSSDSITSLQQAALLPENESKYSHYLKENDQILDHFSNEKLSNIKQYQSFHSQPLASQDSYIPGSIYSINKSTNQDYNINQNSKYFANNQSSISNIPSSIAISSPSNQMNIANSYPTPISNNRTSFSNQSSEKKIVISDNPTYNLSSDFIISNDNLCPSSNSSLITESNVSSIPSKPYNDISRYNPSLNYCMPENLSNEKGQQLKVIQSYSTPLSTLNNNQQTPRANASTDIIRKSKTKSQAKIHVHDKDDDLPTPIYSPLDINNTSKNILGSSTNLGLGIDISTLSTIEVYDPTGQTIRNGARQADISASYWEDQQTWCFQVHVNGFIVARREDNNMINGTKLLNVAKLTRGRRDGLLKTEKNRFVVKNGAMHLKGVWIPLDRALAFANKEKITDFLFPLFINDISIRLKDLTRNLKRAKLSLEKSKSYQENFQSYTVVPMNSPHYLNAPTFNYSNNYNTPSSHLATNDQNLCLADNVDYIGKTNQESSPEKLSEANSNLTLHNQVSSSKSLLDPFQFKSRDSSLVSKSSPIIYDSSYNPICSSSINISRVNKLFRHKSQPANIYQVSQQKPAVVQSVDSSLKGSSPYTDLNTRRKHLLSEDINKASTFVSTPPNSHMLNTGPFTDSFIDYTKPHNNSMCSSSALISDVNNRSLSPVQTVSNYVFSPSLTDSPDLSSSIAANTKNNSFCPNSKSQGKYNINNPVYSEAYSSLHNSLDAPNTKEKCVPDKSLAQMKSSNKGKIKKNSFSPYSLQGLIHTTDSQEKNNEVEHIYAKYYDFGRHSRNNSGSSSSTVHTPTSQCIDTAFLSPCKAYSVPSIPVHGQSYNSVGNRSLDSNESVISDKRTNKYNDQNIFSFSRPLGLYFAADFDKNEQAEDENSCQIRKKELYEENSIKEENEEEEQEKIGAEAESMKSFKNGFLNENLNSHQLNKLTQQENVRYLKHIKQQQKTVNTGLRSATQRPRIERHNRKRSIPAAESFTEDNVASSLPVSRYARSHSQSELSTRKNFEKSNSKTVPEQNSQIRSYSFSGSFDNSINAHRNNDAGLYWPSLISKLASASKNSDIECNDKEENVQQCGHTSSKTNSDNEQNKQDRKSIDDYLPTTNIKLSSPILSHFDDRNRINTNVGLGVEIPTRKLKSVEELRKLSVSPIPSDNTLTSNLFYLNNDLTVDETSQNNSFGTADCSYSDSNNLNFSSFDTSNFDDYNFGSTILNDAHMQLKPDFASDQDNYLKVKQFSNGDMDLFNEVNDDSQNIFDHAWIKENTE